MMDLAGRLMIPTAYDTFINLRRWFEADLQIPFSITTPTDVRRRYNSISCLQMQCFSGVVNAVMSGYTGYFVINDNCVFGDMCHAILSAVNYSAGPGSIHANPYILPAILRLR